MSVRITCDECDELLCEADYISCHNCIATKVGHLYKEVGDLHNEIADLLEMIVDRVGR